MTPVRWGRDQQEMMRGVAGRALMEAGWCGSRLSGWLTNDAAWNCWCAGAYRVHGAWVKAGAAGQLCGNDRFQAWAKAASALKFQGVTAQQHAAQFRQKMPGDTSRGQVAHQYGRRSRHAFREAVQAVCEVGAASYG